MKRKHKLGVLVGSAITFLLIIIYIYQWNLSNNRPNPSKDLLQQADKPEIVDPGESVSKVKLTGKANSEQQTSDFLPKKNENRRVSESDWIEQYELPSPLTDDEIDALIANANATQIWKAQDKIIRSRPVYAKLREKLLKDIQVQMDIENMTVDELVNHGIQYRKRFWEAGGLLSTASFPHAYKARLLLELAHAREPENLEITDQLVEAIQAAWPATMFDEKTNEKIRNEEVNKTLLELRSQQFAQIKKEIQNRRDPCIEDFIRAVDLAVLLSIYDNARAKGVVKWLQINAMNGGWDVYKPQFENFHDYLDRGMSYYCQIYIATKDSGPEMFRYARRCPSFVGPNPDELGLILWGERFHYDQISR